MSRNLAPELEQNSKSEIAPEGKSFGAADITPEHAEYLLHRHKSVDLWPLPSADPADTLNWSSWKKNVNLGLVALSGLVSTGMTVGVVPAFDAFSETYHTSITKASYLGTVPLIFLAIAPLIWIPIADRFGRRPIWLSSVLAAGAFNAGCSVAPTYAAHLVLRICIAIFVAPGIALGHGVIMETFFAKQRAHKMGVWVLMVNSGVFLGPFAVGFIIEHLGWPWMYRIFAMINLLQFGLYLAFGPETIYSGIRTGSLHERGNTAFKRQFLALHRINPVPFRFRNFWEPFLVLANHKIAIAVVAYAVCFGFVLVMVINEMSIVYATKFHLEPQQTGLNFLGMFIGALLGEFVGGPLSDYVVRWRIDQSRSANATIPEDRLVFAQAGFPIIIAGIVVFLVQVSDLKPTSWNLTPTIGASVAAFGMEIVSTVLITYCADCYPNAASSSVGAIINFVRLTWGFLGPFWYPYMFDSCGFRGSAGLVSGLIITFSILPIIYLQIRSNRKGLTV